ncbi:MULTISPECIES: hypothetical protein [unclassified Streptomyces]|uniref:DUF11 domain-containing protein n=1 Tax=Streptomyces sp. NBC_00119 TaxID=2975659 RepID=A0AAU1U903_9ACTN|nr:MULTISPECIES: hypothetical protein [unclassified Streptomyces]MCX4644227.1 hypothetical protein [Streptomyces sp. NBC_01446]MCX5325339.1 hypothetical protein [Streptomyces sp. NBC_00120]WSE06093.1 hypothetical protein OG574_23720 [Streptomyces sp. NBC_01445]
MSALGTVVGLGVALPFALAAPAHAQSNLSVAKSHEGNFARGGQGVYTITLKATGATGLLDVTDNLPTGVRATALGGLLAQFCDITNGGTTVHCGDGLNFIGALTAPLDVTVSIAADAPCSVSNTVTVIETETEEQGGETFTHSASDPTTITGGDCDGGGGGGGGGGSILPINLNGVIPMFNNITTNSNINSPGASNNSHQNFGLNAP